MNEVLIQNLINKKDVLNQQLLQKVNIYTEIRQNPNVKEKQALLVLQEIKNIQTEIDAISLAFNIKRDIELGKVSTQELINNKNTLNQEWTKKMNIYTETCQNPNISKEQAFCILEEIENIQSHLYAISLAFDMVQNKEPVDSLNDSSDLIR